jgi:hypothetical protein
MRRHLSFVLVLSLAACGGIDQDAVTSASSDDLVSCGWLMGGRCERLPSGNWRSPGFWGDFYLNKYAAQLDYANTHIEPGPGKIQTPRTVLLITGVGIRKEWMMPIQKRLERDGFSTVLYEPPALLSGDLEENSRALAVIVDGILDHTGDAISRRAAPSCTRSTTRRFLRT